VNDFPSTLRLRSIEMAKKKSTKKNGSTKAARGTGSDSDKALLLATLKRTMAVVEGAMENKSTRCEPGTYALDASVTVQGDILVAQPVEVKPTEDKAERTFTTEQLLAVLLVDQSETDLRTTVRGMLANYEQVFAHPDDKTINPRLRERLDRVLTVVEDEAQRTCERRKGLTRIVPGRPGTDRAGAVTGKPEVRVSGSFGERSLAIEIDAA